MLIARAQGCSVTLQQFDERRIEEDLFTTREATTATTWSRFHDTAERMHCAVAEEGREQQGRN